jgi:uncharacterized integral membrane protein
MRTKKEKEEKKERRHDMQLRWTVVCVRIILFLIAVVHFLHV